MTHPARPTIDPTPASSGVVGGQPRVWLGLEGAAALAGAVVAYAAGGHGWLRFAVLFFVPDVTFLGYLAGPRVGAACYNVAHTYAVPVGLAIALHAVGGSLAVPLVWAAHVGFDRMMGYGLKYADAFGHTHLGQLGGGRRRAGEASPSAPAKG